MCTTKGWINNKLETSFILDTFKFIIEPTPICHHAVARASWHIVKSRRNCSIWSKIKERYNKMDSLPAIIKSKIVQSCQGPPQSLCSNQPWYYKHYGAQRTGCICTISNLYSSNFSCKGITILAWPSSFRISMTVSQANSKYYVKYQLQHHQQTFGSYQCQY